MTSPERLLLVVGLFGVLIGLEVWWWWKVRPALVRRGQDAKAANGGRHTKSWWGAMTFVLFGFEFFWLAPHLPRSSYIWLVVILTLWIVGLLYLRPWSAASRVPKSLTASSAPTLSAETEAWLNGTSEPPSA
jgi:hypothetical protein